LKITASDQEEKVADALRNSLGTSLGKNGNESRACAVKEIRVTADHRIESNPGHIAKVL